VFQSVTQGLDDLLWLLLTWLCEECSERLSEDSLHRRPGSLVCGCRRCRGRGRRWSRRDVDLTLNSAHVSQLLEPIFALVRIRIFAYKAEILFLEFLLLNRQSHRVLAGPVQRRGYLSIRQCLVSPSISSFSPPTLFSPFRWCCDDFGIWLETINRP